MDTKTALILVQQKELNRLRAELKACKEWIKKNTCYKCTREGLWSCDNCSKTLCQSCLDDKGYSVCSICKRGFCYACESDMNTWSSEEIDRNEPMSCQKCLPKPW